MRSVMVSRILAFVFILVAIPTLVGAPVISTSSLPPAGLGSSYSATLTATQASGPFTWSVPPGALPPGLQLGAATGTISGVPTQGGSYTFTVTVTDQPTNQTGSKSFTITVMQITTPSPLPNGTAGSFYTVTFQVSNPAPPPLHFMISSMPPGMSFDQSQGILSGTPTTPNTYAFTLTAFEDQFGIQTSKNFMLTVTQGAPPAITTASLANAAMGSNYAQTLAVSGGAPPYSSFTVVAGSGTPPPGINLDPTTGTLAGNPTATGTYTFSATVKDSANVTSAPKQLSITVQPRLLITNPSPLPNGSVGTFYSQTLQSTGGTPGYSYQAVQTDPFGSSVLPPGTMLSAGGLLSGTPTATGTYNFGVILTDSAGASAGFLYSITIGTPPSITTPSPLPPAAAGFGYQQNISATGGTPPYSFSFVGQGPAGFTLSSGGLLSGTPANAGTLQFSIQVVDSAKSTASKAFQLPVSAAPPLVVSPLNLTFSAAAQGDSPPPQVIAVISGAGSPVAFSAAVIPVANAPLPSWLKITPANANTPAIIQVSVDQGQLPPGRYPALVRITSPNSGVAPTDVSVVLTVESRTPGLDVTPAVVRFKARPQNLGPFDHFVLLRNTGTGTLDYTVTADPAPWLISTLPLSGQIRPNLPGVLRVRVNAQGLAPGGYRRVIHITSSAGAVDIPVTLFVRGGGSVLGLDIVGVRFDSRQGGALGLTQQVNVLNEGDPGSTVNWSAEQVTGAEWLTLGVSRGIATPSTPSVLTLTISPAGASLPPGAYYSLIRITDTQSQDSPQYLVAVLNQQAANAPQGGALSDDALVFIANGPAPLSRTFKVHVFGSQVPYQVAGQTSDGATWLTVDGGSGIASAGAPGLIKVSASPAGLGPGIYTGLATVSLGGFVRSKHVVMIIPPGVATLAGMASQPAAGCIPSKMAITGTALPGNYQVPAKWPQPLVMQLNDDCGGAVSGATVTARFSTSDPPLVLQSSSAQPNVYSATWQPLTAASEMTVTVEANMLPLPQATAQFTGTVNPNKAPVLNSNGTVNAFYRQTAGALTAGLVVELYGSDMAGTTGVPGVVPLPTLYQGTSVFLGRNQAPLYFVSPGQLDAQIPAELNQPSQVVVVVSANGALTIPDTLTLNPLSPGVAAFVDTHIIAQHADFSLIDAAHPAKPGEIVLMYLVGLGETNPKVASGQPAPGVEPLARVTVTPTVMVDGATATLFYFGQTPFAVGLYQINFQVPSNAKTGDLDVIVMQGGVTANVVKLPVAP